MNYQTMAGNASSAMRRDGPSFRDGDQRNGQDADTFETELDPVETMRRSPTTSPQSFTTRSLLVGIVIGALITFSNTYFGLQTGWISTMAMPSALIGFSVFKVFSKYLSFPFTPIENVLIQTVAGAVGTMPLGCGFVGVIPALEFLLKDGEDGPSGDGGGGEGGPLKLNFWKLVLWSLGVCLFGVVFAVPLRKEVIVREKLKFPSGTASALMLRVLHGSGQSEEKVNSRTRPSDAQRDEESEALMATHEAEESGTSVKDDEAQKRLADRKDWQSKMRLLIGAFGVSGLYVRFLNTTREIHADGDRHSSRTSCLKSEISPSLAFLWRRTGCGLSIHHQRMSGKGSSWAHRLVCTCSLELF